jgi:hypothetical protein
MLAQHNCTRSVEPWYRTAVPRLRAPGLLRIEQIQSGRRLRPRFLTRILTQQKSEPAYKNSRHDKRPCLQRTVPRAKIFPTY